MVKCLSHDLRGFNGAAERRLATLTVTRLISSCWKLSSDVKLRRIFDICKRWANSGSHEFVKINMVRYMRPHGRFAHCSCKNAALTLDLGLSASAAGSCCIFTLGVRQPPVLVSCIEIYYCMDVPLLVQILKCPVIGTFTLVLLFRGLSGGIWNVAVLELGFHALTLFRTRVVFV